MRRLYRLIFWGITFSVIFFIFSSDFYEKLILGSIFITAGILGLRAIYTAKTPVKKAD